MSEESFSDRNPHPARPESGRGEESSPDKKRKFREFGPANNVTGGTGTPRSAGQSQGQAGSPTGPRQPPRFSGPPAGHGNPSGGNPSGGENRNRGHRRGGERRNGNAPIPNSGQHEQQQATRGEPPHAGQQREPAAPGGRQDRPSHNDRSPQQPGSARPAGPRPGPAQITPQNPPAQSAPQTPSQPALGRRPGAPPVPASSAVQQTHPADAAAPRAQQAAPGQSQIARPPRDRGWDRNRIRAEETFEDVRRENERLEKEIWLEIAGIHTLTLD